MSHPDDQQERSEEFERFERLAKAVLKVKKSDIVRQGTITNTLKRDLDLEKVPEKKPRKKRS
jgi:hypothetical protein